MSITTRRILLAVLVIIGAFVGGWATISPTTFAASFPGPGLGSWVGDDGPYNEHLTRDVGELNLAIGADALVALLTRHPIARVAATRVAAVAWTVYSVPHLAYHLLHLGGLATIDAIAEPVALGLTLLVAAALLLPERRSSRAREPRTAPEGEHA